MRSYLALALMFCVMPAMAGEPVQLNSKATKPDPTLCRALIKHTPQADVAYQPGVDVHGNKVAPADLPGGDNVKLLPVQIPLTADLLTVLGIQGNNLPFNSLGRNDINLGTLTVDGDKVLLNGQPLSSAQQDNLAVLCLSPR